MAGLKNLVASSNVENNPITKVKEFMERQEKYKIANEYGKWRFVGYVLELGYNGAKIITNDTYKMEVGGIPRGSYLILLPSNYKQTKSHFTLLRVKGIAPTPLTAQVQQTYFEMHKRSMPELDLWTQSDLQWGALECDVLGMFYADPFNVDKLAFSGDVNNIVSPHRYEVYAPDEELLNIIVNGTVKTEFRETIGKLRTMECQFGVEEQASENIPVDISMRDFMGCRTAMFGKTRLGKSNVVKLLAQGMLDATAETKNVGQLIFDTNGEYANDNNQDGNSSIYSANRDRCDVYALTPRAETPSKQLKLNFYENPDTCKDILSGFLKEDNKNSNYINNFSSVTLPSFEGIKTISDNGDKTRAIRRIQIYWAILFEAGFKADEKRLKASGLVCNYTKPLEPHFNKDFRNKAYKGNVPEQPTTLSELVQELRIFVNYIRESNDQLPNSDKEPLFDKEDWALLNFLFPSTGSSGPIVLAKYKEYHSSQATDFLTDIVKLLNAGKTVILDLGNATDRIRKYFSDILSQEIFSAQERKFVENKLGDSYIQLYFEEAHNLFPPESKDLTDVYSRFAKEGAKFHIGMVYSTQSPSTINRELLVQTENFFVGHLSSQDETKALTRMQIAFLGIEEDILRSRTPGYMRMLTMSHRFVIPVYAKLYQPKKGE